MSAGRCSHPGGAFSGPCETAKGMLNDVDAHLAKGETQEQIIQAFVNQYGAIVYVEPPKHGFGIVAWIMPFFYANSGDRAGRVCDKEVAEAAPDSAVHFRRRRNLRASLDRLRGPSLARDED